MKGVLSDNSVLERHLWAIALRAWLTPRSYLLFMMRRTVPQLFQNTPEIRARLDGPLSRELLAM